jgi:hypothetical protein
MTRAKQIIESLEEAKGGYLLSKIQIDNAVSNKSAGFCLINPEDLLKLTTPDDSYIDIVKSGARDLATYKSSSSDTIAPSLTIKIPSGEVINHEGRHRAASVLRAGGTYIPIALFFQKDDESTNRVDANKSHIPNKLKGQFRPISISSSEFKKTFKQWNTPEAKSYRQRVENDAKIGYISKL